MLIKDFAINSPFRGLGGKRRAPDGQELLLTNYKPIYEKDMLFEFINQHITLNRVVE
jgi:hypothetical protein